MPIEVRDDKLRQLIIELEGTFSGSGIRNALSQAGDAGLAEMHRLVPKGKTGKLEAGCYAEVKSDTTLAVGNRTEYAGYVEYGTSKMGARPFVEPAARVAADVLESLLIGLVGGSKRGRPTTTGAGTYEPTGNKVGRPSSGKTKLHIEASRPDGQHKYISKRKSTSGRYIYDYGDQPRLRTKRIRRSDRRVRGSGTAERGR